MDLESALTITRQATVLVPRPPGSVTVPPLPAGGLGAAPASVLFGQPVAANSDSLEQQGYVPDLDTAVDARSWRRGRHRARGGWGVRFAGMVASIICLAGALGAGWSVGERWARDDGATLTSQVTHWFDGVRDWALGM